MYVCLRCVIQIPSVIIPLEARREMRLSNTLSSRFSSSDMNLHVTAMRPTRFLRILSQQEHYQLGSKEREDKIKEVCYIPCTIPKSRHRLIKLFSRKICYPSCNRKNYSKDEALRPEARYLKYRGLFLGLQT